MKKLTVAALAVTTLLSGSAFAHEAGEFFMRAGSATVRPTEGAGGTLGSLGGFSVTNNTQLGLTFTYMATDIKLTDLAINNVNKKAENKA